MKQNILNIFFIFLFLVIVSVASANKLIIEVIDDVYFKAELISDSQAEMLGTAKISAAEKKMSRKEQAVLQEIREKNFTAVPQTVQFLYSQAEKNHKMGNFSEAIVYCQIITALDPTFRRANDLKVICYKILKEYDKGIEEFTQLQSIYKKNFEYQEYIQALELAKEENQLIKEGINSAIRTAKDKYEQNKKEGIDYFESVMSIYHKAARYEDVVKAIMSCKTMLEEDENWVEAIKISNRYLQIKRNEINSKEWNSIKKQYTQIFEDIFSYFSKLGDYSGYTNWIEEYQKIENKRFVTESSDLIKFYKGMAYMRNRDYEKAQPIFLSIYLDQPSSPYSKDAKIYYDRIKQAIKGFAVVSIKTEPPQADVYIDSLIRGKTPLRMEVADSDHTIKIVKNAYNTYESKIVPNAAEGELILDITLTSSVLTFKPESRNYCPGIILNIINVGEIKWHQDCYGLYIMEFDGPFEKVDDNSIRLESGNYSFKACSFGELYKETGKYIHSKIDLSDNKNVDVIVGGAYIDDNNYPYSVSFKTK